MTMLITCWRWVLGTLYYSVFICLIFSIIKFLKCHIPIHLPHTSCSTIISLMPSTSTRKLLTLQFQWLPTVFQQAKKSTNSACMLDIQTLHFMSTLLQELNLKGLSCWELSYNFSSCFLWFSGYNLIQLLCSYWAFPKSSCENQNEIKDMKMRSKRALHVRSREPEPSLCSDLYCM